MVSVVLPKCLLPWVRNCDVAQHYLRRNWEPKVSWLQQVRYQPWQDWTSWLSDAWGKKVEPRGSWHLAGDCSPMLPAQLGAWGWDPLAPRNLPSQQWAITHFDAVRNLYDRVVPLTAQVKLPLKKHIREIRHLNAIKTPLYEQRALLLALGAPLLPFVQLGGLHNAPSPWHETTVEAGHPFHPPWGGTQ